MASLIRSQGNPHSILDHFPWLHRPFSFTSGMAMTSTSTSNSWIAYSQPNSQAKLRLFCFPYAGGRAKIFGGVGEVIRYEGFE
jgi:hypothetical protein